MLKIIDHVQLPVPDTEAAANWYIANLGFTLHSLRHDLAVLTLGAGPNLFLFRTSDRSTATFTVDGDPYPTIGVQVTGIAALKDRLATVGAKITMFDKADFGTVLKFFDLYGNMWVAHEPHQAFVSEAG